MQSGLLPLPYDKRDRKYRFTRRYGATALTDIPSEFDVDAGLEDPDQMADNRPTACTAYSKCDLVTDMTKEIYNPDYNFAMTLRISNLPPDTQGADLRQAFKAVVAYGLLPASDTPEHAKGRTQTEIADWRMWTAVVDKAIKHAQPSYRWVYDDIYDHFDDIRSAITTFYRKTKKKQGVDWGIPYFYTFGASEHCTLDTIKGLNIADATWHDTKIRGWVHENGKDWLMLKIWEKGVVKKFDRELVNYLYEIPGTAAGMFDPTGNRTWSLFGYLVEAFPEILTVPGILAQLYKIAFPYEKTN